MLKKRIFPLQETGLIKYRRNRNNDFELNMIQRMMKKKKKEQKNEKKNKIFSSCPLIKYFDEDEQMREDEREK